VQVNPFAKLGLSRGAGRSDIDPLTEAEVERLGEIALKTAGHWGPEFWALIIWMGWTGMRPGEICALKTANIDWKAATVRIEQNMRNDGTLGPVKGKRRRTIPLADQAAAAVRTLRRTRGHLFMSPTGRPLRPNSLRYYWVPVRSAFTAQLDDAHWLRQRLMIDPDDQLDPYELRHHCGSMLADRGLSSADIAAYLGNSPKICEETYIHPYRDRQQARLRSALNRPREDTEAPDGQSGRQTAS
jgi:integrase